ncbi:MAG: SCO family protein [Thermoanaerobaculia bacterium]
MSIRFLLVSPVLVLALTACAEAPALPPPLYPVPSVTLVSDAGRSFPLDSLDGKVAIYDFIFTRCGATCPMMTRAMARLTTEFDDEAPVRFVSVTVDPAYDTPEVLRTYAAPHRTDDRWVFLTGEREDVIGLSVDGFKLAAGVPQEGAEPILHSTKFVLVDPEGNVRGYYESGDRESMRQLVEHARALFPD